ncbi:hypothetical protein H6G17_30910 [Chroococcidiopsis sp. FACHB-1243]|uniref:SMODS domain-containing nucleotidyltransferase n=1 Tax=Chroococcidiopsis sp. [FACHB-1243] TaxID=2692781 RepID=UPI00177FABDB|nr:hypothetical protein [Chroococcidiopsis sp. [FACHB-1243]]
MGVGEDFKTFCDCLTIGNSDDVEIRCKAITKRLNIDFWDSYSDTNHRIYVGSYGRDTAIGVSDLDVIFILPYLVYVRYSNYQYNGQSALLQSVNIFEYARSTQKLISGAIYNKFGADENTYKAVTYD